MVLLLHYNIAAAMSLLEEGGSNVMSPKKEDSQSFSIILNLGISRR
jgi:hypothetical protein